MRLTVSILAAIFGILVLLPTFLYAAVFVKDDIVGLFFVRAGGLEQALILLGPIGQSVVLLLGLGGGALVGAFAYALMGEENAETAGTPP